MDNEKEDRLGNVSTVSESAISVVLMGSKEELKVLLVQRKFPPYGGSWALPGGFVKHDETTDDACKREVMKETGLNLEGITSYKLTRRKKEGRDPRGNIEAHCLLFYSKTSMKERISGEAQGIRDCAWFSLDKVPELAFDHGAILCEALGKFWDFMPGYEKDFSSSYLPSWLSAKKVDSKKTIIFFGGSFNPWHEGHRACVDSCPLKNIVIVPDFNPWKANQKSTKSCCFQTYKKLAWDLKDTDYAVYPGFWGKEEANPTIDWFTKVKAPKKGLLVGEDSFEKLTEWKSSSELIANIYEIYVVPRVYEGKKAEGIDQKVMKINPKLKIFHLPHHLHEEVNSTSLRK